MVLGRGEFGRKIAQIRRKDAVGEMFVSKL
jgi:hypothetical protein